jgi:hypothetical protein
VPLVVGSTVNNHFPQTGHLIFFLTSNTPSLERAADIKSRLGGRASLERMQNE